MKFGYENLEVWNKNDKRSNKFNKKNIIVLTSLALSIELSALSYFSSVSSARDKK